ncbi:phage tail tape measure protein [Cupriavidus gilardii]
MEVGLRVRARADEATRAMTRVFTEVAAGSERAERSMAGLARESRRMSDARAVLGVRAEQTIQREIRQTEAAYQRLANAGTMSAREQSRAYDAMRTRVAELRREMAGVNQLQRGMVAGARGLPLVGAAVGTGAAMMARPMGQVASYDMRLAQMANTAFSDTEENGRRLTEEEQLARRRAGKAQLESYITNATAQGGTREDAAGALDMLIARGIFSPDEAGQLLPMITKAATAAGSSAQEMTGVVMAAVQNAKIPIEQIPKALGMALRAGQLGGFELKDMATWLPKMLAMGGLPGLRGTDGMASILAASQLAMTAAGSSDDAGNNVVNFLQKITSADTAKDFAKLSSRTMGDKRKGEAGIDLYGTLAQARSEGVDPIEAFTRLVRRVAEADKEFVRLQKMAAASGDDKEKSAMYGSMADILQSRGVGKTIQDRQAMLALLPMLFNPKQYTDLKAGILQGDENTLNVNQAFIREQAAFKFQQGQNAWEKGQYDALGGLNSAVGDVASKLAEYGAQYPGLTASLVGATTAIKALAAAAMSLLIGGKVHSTWSSYDIDSDLLIPADAWQVELGLPRGEFPPVVTEGERVEVRIGQDKIMTGRIDEIAHRVSRGGHTLSLSGRDGAAILVDCSAPIFVSKQASLQDIVANVVKPLGISRIRIDAAAVATREKVNVEPGESAWDALVHAAEANGLWPWT